MIEAEVCMCTGKDPLLKRYEIPVVWGGDNVALTLISRLVVVHVVWVSFLHRMQDRETEEDRITWQLSEKQHIYNTATHVHIRIRQRHLRFILLYFCDKWHFDNIGLVFRHNSPSSNNY